MNCKWCGHEILELSKCLYMRRGNNDGHEAEDIYYYMHSYEKQNNAGISIDCFVEGCKCNNPQLEEGEQNKFEINETIINLTFKSIPHNKLRGLP